MKKLAFDSSNWKLIGTINDLIDLVKSQQEAIEKLAERLELTERRARYACLHALKRENEELADDKPKYKLPGTEEVIEKLDKATLKPNLVDSIPSDTHRTVTLRIPKGMRVGDAFNLAYLFSDSSWEEFITRSDTDLQKALDEVEE